MELTNRLFLRCRLRTRARASSPHAVTGLGEVKIGGQKIRIGGAVPVKKEEMTAIDVGTVKIDSDGMSFVGGKHTRKWEFKKLVGYLDTGSSELLIGVSNRQKMSGIRYPPQNDHLVDSIFTSFFTVFSEDGDKSSVKVWATTKDAEYQKFWDSITEERVPVLAEMKAQLSEAGATDSEVDAIMAELPISFGTVVVPD